MKRYYELTNGGRRRLEVERSTWERTSTAVNWILEVQWSSRRSET